MSPEHEALLTAFLAEETARGRREQGRSGLASRVPWLLAFLESRGLAAATMTAADAYAYQGSLVEGCTKAGTPYTGRTVRAYLGAASAFCAWLERSGQALCNPFREIRRIRPEARVLTGLLKEGELASLLDALADWNPSGPLLSAARRYRTHVVAELQYASGLRIAEAAALTPTDVDCERALVYVRDGKQGLSRIGFLTDYAADVLDLYLARVRPILVTDSERGFGHTLFLASRDRLSHTVNAELKAAAARAGVGSITSHGLRHALGYHLLRSGCPLRYIQAILGHRSIANTEVYTKVDVEDVQRVFDACHPRMHGSCHA